MTFGSIIQGEHETLQSFVVCLRSSATELYNTTLQTDILSKANQLNTLQETVKHAKAFETALRDQTKLSNEPSAEIFSARDTTNRNTSVKFKPNCHKACSGCGSFNPGSPGSDDRTTKCQHVARPVTSVGERIASPVFADKLCYVKCVCHHGIYQEPKH